MASRAGVLASVFVLCLGACDSSESAVQVPGTPAPSFGGSVAGGGLFPVFGPSGRPVRLDELRTAATPPPPISGGTLAVSQDGKRAVAADPDRDSVYIMELDTLKVQKLSLPQGSEPGRVALDASGGAHVVLRAMGKLLRVDLASAAISSETEVCAQPRGVSFDVKSNTVVTACMDGQVVSLDAPSHRETQRETLPQDLRDVAVNASGARWITRYRNAELLARQADGSIKASRPSQRKARKFLFDRSSGGPQSKPAETVVTMSPALAWRSLPSQRGGVWMLHQQSQEEEVVLTEGGYGSGCQTITTGALTEFAGDGMPVRSMPIHLQGLSVDAALSPDEKLVAVASPGAYARGALSLQLYSTESMRPSGEEPTPNGDPGECPMPVSQAAGESQTVAVAFDGAGVLYTFSREPAELQIYEIEPLSQPLPNVPPFVGRTFQTLTRTATIALDRRSARDTGHDLFHVDVGQGLACASCHGEALDDGHVWTFEKIGPRRTQNMRGGLLRTAPFHWDGDMPSIGHLVDEVMSRRMGGFHVEPSFAQALGKWIDHQPALSLPASDTAAVARGKALFESSATKCSTCHSGPSFTNNESADVGTGGNFQVPGLLGLALRAPYMHDGCAKTLEDRFLPECGGGDAHGKTSQLDTKERADLIAYLSSL